MMQELLADYQCSCPADFSGKNCDTCNCELSMWPDYRSIDSYSIIIIIAPQLLFLLIIQVQLV